MSTPDERSAALLAQLDARGVALSMQVMAEIYADPFWRARFGDRGRRHADQDSDFHIQHLREALAARDARVMTRYARWLQSVLTTRGMCSLHLADNFARLAVVLSRELEGGAEVQVYLQSARRR